jgi:hypothetical protein
VTGQLCLSGFRVRGYIWRQVQISPYPSSARESWRVKELEKNTRSVGIIHGFGITPRVRGSRPRANFHALALIPLTQSPERLLYSVGYRAERNSGAVERTAAKLKKTTTGGPAECQAETAPLMWGYGALVAWEFR